MTADLIPTSSPDHSAVLHQAATAFQAKSGDRPRAEAVAKALLQAEKTAKRDRLTYPFAPLCGTWRLCFATGTRKVRRGGIVLGNGFYVPQLANAQISFSAEAAVDSAPGRGAIANQVDVGPVLLRFTGPAHYLGKKNLLAFDFTHLHIGVLGKTVYSGQIPGRKPNAKDFYRRSVASLPFFAFFLITPTFIAARGRGGGLALWVEAERQ